MSTPHHRTDLKSRLRRAAEIWAAAHDPEAPMSRLGKRVAGDANFFVRLEAPEATLQVATLERFATFLGDAGNWPGGTVPAEVCAFVHIVGVSSAACGTSADSCALDIGAPDPLAHGPDRSIDGDLAEAAE